MNQSKRTFRRLAIASAVLLSLAGCGGGGSGTIAATPEPVSGVMSGVAAVGSPIVGGTVKIVCAAGAANPTVVTSTTGAWQTTVSGQTFPCAVQVSGGTIGSTANLTLYHALAPGFGTVNITPLTDLLVANMAATASLANWFTALSTTATPLQALGTAQADAALTRLRAALSTLTPLGTVNPVTTVFTATPGNTSDDMLSALQSALSSTGITYATLLSSAATLAMTPPAGFGAAVGTAYRSTISGTPAVAIAPAPAGVQVAVGNATQLNLSWSAASGAASYNVYRATTPSVQVMAGNRVASGITALTYQDTGLTATTTYYYKLTAVNSAGESVGSAEVTGNTPAPAVTVPPAPQGLAANAAGASQINLSWSASNNATGYNVYRTTAAGVAITAANKITATPITTLTFNNTTGLAAATAYFYKVTAVNSAGESTTGSSEVTATTGAAVAAGTPVLLAGATSTYSTNNFDNTGADARFAAAQGLVADAAGNVYVADAGNRSIRKITPAGVVTTFAGPDYAACGGALTLGTSCPVGDTDGTGTAARFRIPNRIAIDANGNLYVGDQNRIRKITPSGVVSTLAGPDAASWEAAPTGNGLIGFTDGTGSAARFGGIEGLAADSLGNIFVADYGNHLIRKVTPAGVVTTFAGPSNSTCTAAAFGDCPNGYVNGTGSAARFSAGPSGIAIDAADNIYIVDSARVRKITPAAVVTTFAGIDVGGPFLGPYVDATGTAARFTLLIGLAIDPTGNLYVADGYGGTGNNLIRKVTPAGVVTTVLGALNTTDSFLKPNFATNKSYWIAVNASSLFISQEGRIAVVNPKP